MNGLKTALLLGIMSGLLLAGGEMFAGRNGLYIALAIAVFMNFFSYFFSDKMALSMYSAQPVTPTENSEVYACFSHRAKSDATHGPADAEAVADCG